MKIRVLLFVSIFLFCFFYVDRYQITAQACNQSIRINTNKENNEWVVLVDTEKPDFLDGVDVSNPCNEADSISLSVDDSFVEMDLIGEYRIYYIAINSDGLFSILAANVSVREDIEKPILSHVADLKYEVYTEIDETILLKNITAHDAFDGEITDKITVNYEDLNPNEIGSYEITYRVVDNNRNVTTQTVNVYIVDETAPEIILKEPKVEINIFEENINWLDYVIISDNYDLQPVITIDTSLVKNDTFGTYDVVYKAVDNKNNEMTVTLSVEITDNLAPEITFMDGNTIEVFTDDTDYAQFINVEDNYDEYPIVEIDASGVNFSVIGVYDVIYKAEDCFGNINEVIMKVNVVDSVAPEIKNLGEFEYLLGDELPDFLSNIEATDNYDGVIPKEKIMLYEELVDYEKPGLYFLYYDVTDSSGNHTFKSVIVRVYEAELPVITGLHNFKISFNGPKPDYLEGITATDNFDGDITDRIYVDESLIDYSVPGTYILSYIVSDSSGNMITKRVSVLIGIDTSAPTFSGLSTLTIEVGSREVDYRTGVWALDDYDKVTFSYDDSQVNVDKLGSYYVVYTSTDHSGNRKDAVREVRVVDSVKPIIENVTKKNIFQGQQTNLLKGIKAIDNYDGDITDKIKIYGDYDINKAGIYKLAYEVTDNSGNTERVEFLLEIRPSYLLLIASFFGGILFLALVFIPVIMIRRRRNPNTHLGMF